MSFLEQDITKKKWVEEKLIEFDFDIGNSKEYKIQAMQDSVVYVSKAERHLLGFYYRVA